MILTVRPNPRNTMLCTIIRRYSSLCTVLMIKLEGEAHIYINDNPVPMNISDCNSRAGYHKTVPIEVILHPGDDNILRIGALGSRGK